MRVRPSLSLAVGKEQCVIVGAVNKALGCIEGLDKAALRALVAVGLCGICQAGTNEYEREQGEDQGFHLEGSLVICPAMSAKMGAATSPP